MKIKNRQLNNYNKKQLVKANSYYNSPMGGVIQIQIVENKGKDGNSFLEFQEVQHSEKEDCSVFIAGGPQIDENVASANASLIKKLQGSYNHVGKKSKFDSLKNYFGKHKL